VGRQGIAADGRTSKRQEVDLGIRHRRSSDRMVDGGSAQRSEYQNHAALPQRGGEKTRLTANTL
jgi:hypothetical protein